MAESLDPLAAYYKRLYEMAVEREHAITIKCRKAIEACQRYKAEIKELREQIQKLERQCNTRN